MKHIFALAAAFSASLNDVTTDTAAEPLEMTGSERFADTVGQDNREDRREDRRDDRDDRSDDRQDCRQAEGVGDDKRDCKQDKRQDRNSDG